MFARLLNIILEPYQFKPACSRIKRGETRAGVSIPGLADASRIDQNLASEILNIRHMRVAGNNYICFDPLIVLNQF